VVPLARRAIRAMLVLPVRLDLAAALKGPLAKQARKGFRASRVQLERAQLEQLVLRATRE
jgi:hypothetical protein